VDHFLSRAAGGAQPNISQAIIRETKIPLPPLAEQRRIAAILDQADGLRRKRKRAIELLDSLTHSIFLEMFGRSFEGDTCHLSELVDTSDRINYGVVQPGDDNGDGVFLIRVSDLRNGRVDHSNLRRVSSQISQKHARSVLRGNEVLISCVGSIGEIAIVSELERGYNIARAVARVPISDSLTRLYIAEYLRSRSVQEYFTKELRTVSQPTLNIKQISETLVSVPHASKLKEFANRVRSAGLGLEFARSYLLNAESLFSSLQHRAFSGQ
jgi:type I restriction enzyme, S subunit